MAHAELSPAQQPGSIFEDPPIEEQIMVVTADTDKKKTFERRPWTEDEAKGAQASRSIKHASSAYSNGLARAISNIYIPDLKAATDRAQTIAAINLITFPALEQIGRQYITLDRIDTYTKHFDDLADIRRGLRPFLVFSDVRAANRHLFPEK